MLFCICDCYANLLFTLFCRNALSEVCILLDVLQVMKEKKYLVLEPVSQNPEPPKQVVQMIGKRKVLSYEHFN